MEENARECCHVQQAATETQKFNCKFKRADSPSTTLKKSGMLHTGLVELQNVIGSVCNIWKCPKKWEPKAFLGQPRDIVPPTCPSPSLRSPPGGTFPEQLSREAKRHRRQIPEPPRLVPLNVEEQRLFSELLLGDRAPHPVPNGAPSHPGHLVSLVVSRWYP